MSAQWRNTFDQAASLYDVRPKYPLEIIEAILTYGQLGTKSNILEVGVGTGQITLPFAQRGFCITGLELGENLAQQARKNLQAFPNVNVEHADFEKWQASRRFDLLLSAQAFHWIDPEIGLRQAASLLKPSGSIALVWTLDESQDMDFYKATSPIYEKYIPKTPDRPTPQKGYQYYKETLQKHSSFKRFYDYSVNWQHTHSKDNYLKLLDTFSDHRSIPEVARAAFRQELSLVIDDFGGSVRRNYKTVLLAATFSP